MENASSLITRKQPTKVVLGQEVGTCPPATAASPRKVNRSPPASVRLNSLRVIILQCPLVPQKSLLHNFKHPGNFSGAPPKCTARTLSSGPDINLKTDPFHCAGAAALCGTDQKLYGTLCNYGEVLGDKRCLPYHSVGVPLSRREDCTSKEQCVACGAAMERAHDEC
ncbi:hypothetical protein H920_12683 [Fukomys damarensis]|uniref:Uncharacterized protein n=1 Tax=Fukomys damarensis TaxID=885580 RepID=A0A091D4F6_FUKDA|nr:hypothetical protein H920_12683 [Fukomys damarensis]